MYDNRVERLIPGSSSVWNWVQGVRPPHGASQQTMQGNVIAYFFGAIRITPNVNVLCSLLLNAKVPSA